MPLPANWSTVTVTGQYLNIDGTPLKGSVYFSSTVRLIDGTADVIVPPSVERAHLDDDGVFSVTLLATDDPDVAPQFYYQVDEDLTLPQGRRSSSQYLIQLPSASPTVDLADVAPVTDVAEVSPYLRGVDLGTVVETPAGAQAKADAAQDAAEATAAAAYVARDRIDLPITTRPHVMNSGSAGLSNGTDTSTTYRYRHQVLVDGRALRLVFTNYYNNGGTETDGVNDITVRAGIEHPLGGTAHPVFFNGRRSVVIEPGGMAVSDPIGITVAAGDFVRTRTYVQVGSAGQKWPVGSNTRSADNEGTAVGVDAATSGTITSASVRGYGPDIILGQPKAPVASPTIVIVGDSITIGNNDSVVTDRGWVGMSIEGELPMVHLGLSGDKLQNVADSFKRRRRWAYADLANASVALMTLGVNDILTARTFAQMQADAQAVFNMLAARGLRVYAGTITPVSTSTDGWATTGGQTVGTSEVARVAYNGWLRTVPAPLTGVVEIADVVETARNSGIWKVPGYTADGVHPTTAGYTDIAAAVPASLFGPTL